MPRFRLPALALAVVLLAAGAPALQAADAHHDHGHGGLEGLALNHGAKWKTDASARQGMDGIHKDVAAVLPRLREGKLAGPEADSFVHKLHGHIDFMAANCKLAPETDAQLHMVLGEILEATKALKTKEGQVAGAERLTGALKAYGSHFEHPGWK